MIVVGDASILVVALGDDLRAGLTLPLHALARPAHRGGIGLWHAGRHSPTIRSVHCSLWTYRGDPDDLAAGRRLES